MTTKSSEKPKSNAKRAGRSTSKPQHEPAADGHRELRIKDSFARKMDAALATTLAKVVGNLPPHHALLAAADWACHLALAPGKLAQLLELSLRESAILAKGAVRGIDPPAGARFDAPEWKQRPFALLARANSAQRKLWQEATSDVPGLARGNAALTQFNGVQLLEALAPDHWPLTNPEVLGAIRETRGRVLLKGAGNLAGDVWRKVRKQEPESDQFRVGETLAATPGKVIFQNRLIELIQYSPTTSKVHAEPVLIVPAWIMKYYILDLQSHNSLVRWLVGQGHTVFIISWKNPQASDRELSMDDYYELGALAALDAVQAVVPRRKIHAVGYCVGGTLLSIAAAAMSRDGDDRLKSVTLFAAQTDFSNPGELSLFINESTLHWLDAQMHKRGYLEASQMSGAFAALRAHDLLWAPLLRRYCLGEKPKGIDIMAWNADATRMPFRMHSDYLRQLYLENQLSHGRYRVDGKAVSVGDIRVPTFVVGTETDHVAPWRSVYQIRKLKRLGETTFVLTKGGHNAGIVSEPGHPRRHFRIGSWDESSTYRAPDEWAAQAEKHEGSWWTAWGQWLREHSGNQTQPPSMGAESKGYAPLCDAPGTYIYQR